MKPFLSKAGETLRDQVNSAFPDRDKKSDGWLGDQRHATRKSDHNPDSSSPKSKSYGVVRAIDLDKDFNNVPNTADYLADQIRLAAKSDKRVAYIIWNKRIASAKSLWRFIPYSGINSHTHHIHVSFKPSGDFDGKPFDIPLLNGDK